MKPDQKKQKPPAADKPPGAHGDERALNQAERKGALGDETEFAEGEGAVLKKDTVDAESDASFPASDPPSHTGTTAGGPDGEPGLELPVKETLHKPATPRSVQKTRRREKERGRP